jgi:hypothetical protein
MTCRSIALRASKGVDPAHPLPILRSGETGSVVLGGPWGMRSGTDDSPDRVPAGTPILYLPSSPQWTPAVAP